MKQIARIVCIICFASLCVIFLFVRCSTMFESDAMTKEEARAFLEAQEPLLLSAAKAMEDFPEDTFVSTTRKRPIDQSGIRGLYRRNYNVYEQLEHPILGQVLELPQIRSVYKDEKDCIEFYCGGAGFGSSTMYTRIYYAPSAETVDFCIGTVSADGAGVCGEWNGDYGYVEEIADGFFFTEEYY